MFWESVVSRGFLTKTFKRLSLFWITVFLGMRPRNLVDRNKAHGVICYKIIILIHTQKPHVLFLVIRWKER